eukprot:5246504-Prymnesium_polylepis.1
MHSGRWAEAAHLVRPILAPNWNMLPSLGTSPCRPLRRWSALHRSSACSGDRGANFPAEVGRQPVPQNSETCDSSHTAPVWSALQPWTAARARWSSAGPPS